MKSVWSKSLAVLALLMMSAAVGGATTRPANDAEQIAIRPRTTTAARGGTAKASEDGGLGVWRVMGALALVLGAIAILQWLGRRMLAMPTSGGAGGAIRILSRTTIAPRQQLILVQVGRRVVLASNCGAQINSLCEITDPEEITMILGQIREAKTATVARPFMAFFGKAGGEFDGQEGIGETRAMEANEPGEALAATREEIGGLLEKVRSLSKVTRKG